MSFHFKTLRLKDWLVYGGTTELSFSSFVDGENIVTIHGQNGFGKTSLLRALEFLFHGDMGRQEYFEHWHDRARENGEGSMAVELEFDFDANPFKLTRRVDFKPRGEDKVYAYPDFKLHNLATGELEDQAEDKVELMIPEKSQQFVFFDGAEITRYAQKQHEDGIRGAIERMLGIPAVRNLGEDLGKLTDQLEDKQAEIASLEDQSQELLAEIDDLKRERESYERQRRDKKDKLQSVVQAANELEQETAEISRIESEQQKLKEKQERLKDYEDRRKEKKEEIDRYIETAPLRMLQGPLTQIIQQAQAQQDGGTTRKVAYQQQRKFLESLLDEADCVCGRDMTDSAADKIEHEIERLSDLEDRTRSSSSESMLNFAELSSLSGLVNQIRNDDRDGEELSDALSAIDTKIEEIETDISRLRRELEGHEDVDIAESIRQLRQLSEQQSTFKDEIASLEENIQRVTKEIEAKQRELDETTADTKEGSRVTQTLQTTRNLGKAVDEFVNRLVEEKRSAIEENATDIFTDITNKPDEYAGVRVNDDYTLKVYRHDGTVVENEKLSAGEKEVLAYSFITALNLSSVNPAPFVMDTPFGHLDSEHRDRLLQSLPRLDVQVFLLATDRDLPEQERDRIQPYLADEFVIERDQQQARSTIEPENA
jgi:DNA sulfur modification protein DndD